MKGVPSKEVERMILAYLEGRPGPHFASEIADQLALDYALAFHTISHLLESRKIRRSKVQA